MRKISYENWIRILLVVAFIAFVFYRPGQMALNSFASKTSTREGVGNIWDKEIRSNGDGTYDISYRYDLCVPNGGCFGSDSVYEINVPGNYTGIIIGFSALVTASVMKYKKQINQSKYKIKISKNVRNVLILTFVAILLLFTTVILPSLKIHNIKTKAEVLIQSSKFEEAINLMDQYLENDAINSIYKDANYRYALSIIESSKENKENNGLSFQEMQLVIDLLKTSNNQNATETINKLEYFKRFNKDWKTIKSNSFIYSASMPRTPYESFEASLIGKENIVDGFTPYVFVFGQPIIIMNALDIEIVSESVFKIKDFYASSNGTTVEDTYIFTLLDDGKKLHIFQENLKTWPYSVQNENQKKHSNGKPILVYIEFDTTLE